MLPIGTQAPDFTLHVTADQTLSLADLRGNPVVLAFYPADWSPVCGDQMVLYNQMLPLFHKHQAQLLGISVDSAWCHAAFSADRHLHFPLLADSNPPGQVCRLYGALDTHTSEAKRILYVLDGQGVIRWAYESPTAINPGGDGILSALEALETAT